jgi:hypothetical protein
MMNAHMLSAHMMSDHIMSVHMLSPYSVLILFKSVLMLRVYILCHFLIDFILIVNI